MNSNEQKVAVAKEERERDKEGKLEAKLKRPFICVVLQPGNQSLLIDHRGAAGHWVGAGLSPQVSWAFLLLSL